MNFYRLLLPALLALTMLEKPAAQTVPPELENLLNNTLDSMKTVLGVKSLGAAMQLSNGAIWARSTGISSQTPFQNVTPAHAYAIGSITKSITAACVLQLADEGVLNLDDPLHLWLDTFQFVNPNITIRQLLRHESGLYDVITNPAYNTANNATLDSIWSLENLIRDFMKPQLFAPGAGWSYSNTNYALLGLIVEEAAGNTYYAEYRERFFTPLGLSSLALIPYDPLPVPRAHLWLNLGSGTLEDADWFFSNWISFFTSAGPMGGYFSTPTDVAVWMRAFMSGQLHTPGIMAQAKTVVTAPGLPGGTKYGLGLMERTLLGYKGYGHGGDIGYSSFSLYFPDKDVSIAVLNNDQTKTSWALVPVIQALLKACINYEMSVSANSPFETNDLAITFSPNPFSEKLGISIELPQKAESVEVVLTNSMGQEVAANAASDLPVGNQDLSIANLENLPEGIYFARLSVDGKPVRAVKVVRGKQ
ncbi:MAG: serine hydrolase [Saprospiraceae bacterium]